MKPLWPEEQASTGRPPGRVERLLYHRPSNTLVAVMVRSEPPDKRLYYRLLPNTAYHPIAVRHELETQHDPHCCERTPYLFFNEMRFRQPRPNPPYMKRLLEGKDLPHEGWKADWLGIRRFNLATREDVRVLDEESLHVPLPYTSGWVSQILSVSADWSDAVCVVGLDSGSTTTYFVYELSFTGGLGRQVAELPQAFL